MSLARHNYHQLSENGVNDEISRALHLSYSYLNAACYYDRDDVALPNIHKYFMKLSDEKRELAFKLIHYQNERGGKVRLESINKPEETTFEHAKDALVMAIQHEKKTNDAFRALCEHAEKNDDPHLSDFIEEELLEPVVDSLKKLADLHTNAKRVGKGLGEYVFDRESF